MKVYRRNPKNGFIESINTDGNFCPRGWSTIPPQNRQRDYNKHFIDRGLNDSFNPFI